MSYKNLIDPLNRVEGDMAIELTVDDNNVIEDARVLGFVYRGFENVFVNKRPFDAMRMSQRSCGVCPVSHGTAGARAIENMIGFKIPRNAQLVRDIVQGTNTIVSHLTHFYFMWGPDLAHSTYKNHPLYPEIVKRFDPLKSPHLKDVLVKGRIPLHSIVATFGGKFPHPMHAIPGGVCCSLKPIELIKTDTRLKEVKSFVEEDILNGVTIEEWLKIDSVEKLAALMQNANFANSDVGFFIRAGQAIGLDRFGEKSYNKFISFGFGYNKDGSMLFRPGYLQDGVLYELNQEHIAEDTKNAYYEDENEWRHPTNGKTKPVPRKAGGAYSWIKAARYYGHAAELGPLARLMVNGDPLITDLVSRFGVNTFTRTLARLHEALLIIPKLVEWLAEIDLEKPFYKPFPENVSGKGVGLHEAPRGGIGHWVNAENGITTSYQIITPSTWNCSPADSKGQKGPAEYALIGVKLKTKDSMIEAAHIVRSFDPCISCSIHAVGKNKRESIFIEPTR